MDNSEALELLSHELDLYRPKSYFELQEMITGTPISKEIRTYNDADYNVEVVVNWEDKSGGNIKVLAFVEDGEMRSFFPLTKYFIKTEDNQTIDE